MSDYVVYGLGAVGVRSADHTVQTLSAARRRLLAALIAAGPRGLDSAELTRQLTGQKAGNEQTSAAALRMAVARLRKVLPDGALPESQHGRYALHLPAEAVDIWHLLDLAKSGNHANTVSGLQSHMVDHLLSYDPVLADVGESEVLERCRYAVRAAQRTLIRQLASEGQAALSGRLVPHLEAHAAEDPWNENLAYVLASAKAGLGDRRGAISVLAETRSRLVSAGLDLSEELNDLEISLLEGRSPQLRVPPTVSAPTAAAPLSESYLGLGDLLERAAKLLQGCEPTHTLVIRGESGSGLTTALDAIEPVAVAAGWRVMRLTPTRHARAAFGPLLAVYPDLYDAVRTILAMDEDGELRQARLWVAVRSVLLPHSDGSPLAIFIDDVQWLDSYSRQFFAQLLASQSDGGVALILAGKDDEHSLAAWAELNTEAMRRQAMIHDLARFNVSDLRELIRQRVPTLPSSSLEQLAATLMTRSGGLPGAADAILRFSEPNLAKVPGAHTLSGLTTDDISDTDLAPTTLRLGAAAAVLARPAALRELARVSGLSLTTAKHAVDELLARRLLKTVGAEYGVTNALVAAKLLAAQSKTDLIYLHAAAAACGGGSHEFARHARSAVPIISQQDAALALLGSAREWLHDGLAEESAAAFAEAEQLSVTSWTTADHLSYVRALDLAGRNQEAQRRRERLADSWLDLGLWLDTLDLAICGLPEAEPIDGSLSIVSILDRIDAAALPPSERFRYHLHLSRQSAIVGQIAKGIEHSKVALELANTPDERLAATLNQRFAMSATTEATVRLGVLGAVDESGVRASDLLAQHRLVRAIDEFELGMLAKAAQSIAELQSFEGLSVVRRWHSLLFQATLAVETGASKEADNQRRAALDFARAAGLAEADNAYLISVFADMFADGTAALLIDGVDNGLVSAETNLLTRASVTAILYAAGRVKEAVDHAERVATAVLDSPVSQGAAALALSAEALGQSAKVDLRGRAFDLLMARGNTLLIVGAGAACLGPTRLHAAWLAPSDAVATDCRNQARTLCESASTFRWQFTRAEA